MRSKLIVILAIFCIYSSQSQTPITDFNLSMGNDTVRMVEEYYPALDLRVNMLDLSVVDAACSKSLLITSQGNLLSLYEKGSLLSAYRINKEGMRVEYEPVIQQMFAEFGKISMTNVSNNYLLDFPIENLDSKKNQEHGYEVSINNPDKRFGNYNYITAEVYVTQSIESFERRQVNYPFGQRLTVPIKVQNVYVIGDVYGYQKSNKTKIDSDLFSRQLPNEPITYYYLLNQYQGTLLAEIKVVGDETHSVRVYEESNQRSFLSECIEDQEGFQLYPNPSYGRINIMLNNQEYGSYRLEIFSVIGKLLYSQDLPHDTRITKSEIILPYLPKGTYLYSIIDPDDHRLYTRRLTIVDF